MPTTHHTRAPVAAVAVIALGLVGCGTDTTRTGQADDPASTTTPTATSSSSDEPATSPTEEPEPAAAAPAQAPEVLRTWLQAITDGNADVACELQTQRYTDDAVNQFTKEGWLEPGAGCPQIVAMSAELISAFGGSFTPTDTTIVHTGADTVVVKVTYTDSDPEFYRLTTVDGQWRVDDEASTLAKIT